MYKLTNNVDIEIIIGQQLSATPRLLLYDVAIYLTTCNSSKEITDEILTTNGSDRGWLFTEDNDTFRFNAQDNLLASICIDYSELDRYPDGMFDLVTEAKKIVGIPKLIYIVHGL
ncbi:hypothetical protein OF897_08180 [Chryseobacterium formosus]|uniref:Uncharacterized protein n=1 Tax=Chryseobacterium formosus TaxID=1537363 RepID=A0ABT3XS04_9FLAO|nr:hypothetical protein [Chryseobacterium formosus]MCX8523901.1 hypothetical protein [Chryseobacterium formosus]